MSLETRAAHAVRSIKQSASVASPVGMQVVTRRHRRSVVAGLVGALTLAIASIALASVVPFLAPSDDTATITPDPNEPDPGQLIILPDGGDDAVDGINQRYDVSDSPEPYTFFFGTAEPGTLVQAISEFGSAEVIVGEKGQFELKLWFEGDLPVGEPIPVTLRVGDEIHEFSFTWLWNPDDIEISAHQTYGHSERAEAFEKFFGTAPPGTVVIASSPFGSADTVVGEHGEWYLKLWFEPLPFDDPFEIELKVGDEVFVFEFVSLFDGLGDDIEVAQQGTTSDSPNPYTRFVGHAPPGTQVLATSAYGSEDLTVGESGEFSLKLWFSPLPPKGVKFPVTLKIDGETWETYYFTSYYSAGPVTFSIHQYNTESESPEPWVKFTGTAAPGTHILATSAYGAHDIEVGGNGEYTLKLFFSTLPPKGVEFPVTIKVNGSTHGSYPFTSWFDPEAAEVTVHQYNTQSDAAEPWIKFYGTAPVGSQIKILSDYGSWTWNTEAYEWSSGPKYLSPLPTSGVPFSITVKVNGETQGTYSFTWYAPSEPDITVNHQYSSCSVDPPFDHLWGTAPAGSTVSITSPYGNASVTVGESGNWEKNVYFSGAPYGQEFQVKVKVNGETYKTYGFVVYPPE